MLKDLLRRHFLSLFLLTLFVGYVGCVFTFRHAHVIDGVIIVHSHPSGGQDHAHTKGEVYVLAAVSDFTTTFDIVPYFDFNPYPVRVFAYRVEVPVSLTLGFVHPAALRGPPTL